MADHHELCIAAAEIAEALGKGKQIQGLAPGSWTTRCPGPLHKNHDEHPSLDIRVDEQIVFKCRVGCDNEDIIVGIHAAGIVEIPVGHKQGKTGNTVNKVAHEESPSDAILMTIFGRIPEALYTYRDVKGRTVFCTARLVDSKDPKKKTVKPAISVTSKADPAIKTWINQAYPPDQGRPLYNLPELMERKGAPVLVVEGEKTAEAAKKKCPEYVVTTWAGGSTAVKSSDWKPLAGRKVSIWADNDAPGMKAQTDVCAVLCSKGRHMAKSVRRVLEEESTDFPDKWDLADPYLDHFPSLGSMLKGARDVDPDDYLDQTLPADDAEIKTALDANLNKYAVLLQGSNAVFVNMLEGSPHRGETIPFPYHSKSSLLLVETSAYLLIGRNNHKRRRLHIENYLESNDPRKIVAHNVIYSPATKDRIIKRGSEILLNLYMGFIHPSKPCDPSLYQCFIDHVMASCATKEEGIYLLDWFAAKFQNPERMLETMVILSGRQGVGKTIVCDIVAKIMGRHNAAKIGMLDLTGNHNSQYANKLFINVEEYDPVNTKAYREYREKIKNLITAKTMMVNPKMIAAYENPAYHNIIATTNALTPESISFDNRRLTFIRFDNPRLKTEGRMVRDMTYFQPLIDLYESPGEALSGLCWYLSNRKITMDVSKPLDTDLTKEALTFTGESVFEFAKSIAETGVLPELEEMPSNNTNNPYPIGNWPEQPCALPRSVANEMFRKHTREYRYETLSKEGAGRSLKKLLMRPDRAGKYTYPKGIPEDFDIDKQRLWEMIDPRLGNTNSPVRVIKDRALVIPAGDELRQMLDELAGIRINWDPFSKPIATDSNVVELRAKKPADDAPQF